VICLWLRILLVEDNLEISEVMVVYCNTQKDIDCKVINNGREALDRIRDENFDLILLDLAMPKFSGKDVIQSFTRDELVQMNIVIFTASSDPGVLEQIKNSGVKEIFKKPFSLDDLAELIEKYRPTAWGYEKRKGTAGLYWLYVSKQFFFLVRDRWRDVLGSSEFIIWIIVSLILMVILELTF